MKHYKAPLVPTAH